MSPAQRARGSSDRGGGYPRRIARSPLDSLPNVLTCFRVALVPLVTVVILVDPDEWQAAAVVFAVAAVTDALDGYIARARRCVSRFGTFMDPVADKLLIGASLIALTSTGRANVILPVVIIAREVAVTVLRLHARSHRLEISASPLGKAKMVLQVAMVLSLMALTTDTTWVQGLVYTTVGLTILSGLDYFAAYRRAMRPVRARAVPVATERF
jgi:CDP-diacylglycerol--glycerol-3-phosphate 3-phosphatidyltransferase